MNLDNIPEDVWTKLASKAIKYKSAGDLGVIQKVRDTFYDIYEKGSQQFKYVPTGDLEMAFRNTSWKEKVESMQDALKNKQLKDVKWDGYGKPLVQSNPDPLQARLGEQFNNKPDRARFQFVVKTGGGVNLFDRMKEACRLYIKDKCEGDEKKCVVKQWKVFSETGGSGRSDSCVVYLNQPYTRPSVAELIDNYIWPRIKGFVEDRFEPMGLFRIGGKAIFGLNFTQVSDEVQAASLNGKTLTDSAGHSIGTVLGKAFADAVKSFNDKPAIINAAKQNANGLLFDLRLLPWRPDDSTQNCAKCDEAFTFFNRRHHCRVCGDIFCDDCCKEVDISRITLPVEAPKGPEKGDVYVCDYCQANLESPDVI